MAKLNLDDRLNQIEDKISEKSFRENKGLGNEVGYYIFDYDPREEMYVRNHIAYLKDRINNGNKDFRIVEFDLFHLMVEILQEEGYLEAFFDLEKENGFFEMADSLVETLGLDETNELNLIISRILQEDLTDSVVFLTGVGKCHPIIASHNILNNLHQVLDSVPVVLFYPGEYSGQDLKLFGTMDSHNYYRAFAEVLRPRINQRFDEIWEKLRTSSDIAAIKNIKLESDTLKIKCLDEIDEYERAHQSAPEPPVAPVVPGKEPINPTPALTKVKTKRRKNVSISNVAGARTYSIETEQDIDKFLAEMKQKLMKELEEDTIITLS